MIKLKKTPRCTCLRKPADKKKKKIYKPQNRGDFCECGGLKHAR